MPTSSPRFSPSSRRSIARRRKGAGRVAIHAGLRMRHHRREVPGWR
jgi:hypothetical protein